MNKLLLMSCVMAASMASCALVRSWAAVPPQAPKEAKGATRIAFVNVEYVLKKYKKAQGFKADMEEELEPFKVKGQSLNRKIVELKKKLQNAVEKREEDEQLLQEYAKELQELQRQVGKTFETKTKAQVMALYTDIAEATKRYARAHGIQVVFSSSDGPPGDPQSLESAMRKLGANRAGVVPLYIEPEADLSRVIVDDLNRRHEADRQKQK